MVENVSQPCRIPGKCYSESYLYWGEAWSRERDKLMERSS
jgi:hypothetical protein